MIFCTGDLHGEIKRVLDWMDELDENKKGDHYLIQLGDAGLNYYLDERDHAKKELLQKKINWLKEKGIQLQILFVRGNHECRPENIPEYTETYMYGGTVYAEEKYPDLIFLKDGEIYYLEEKHFWAIGGGYSKDFFHRVLRGEGYWFDEQLDVKEFMDIKCKPIDPEIPLYVVSHVLPIALTPDKKKLFSRKTFSEYWMEVIWENYSNQIVKWFSGHYHDEKVFRDGVFEVLYKSIKEIQ